MFDVAANDRLALGAGIEVRIVVVVEADVEEGIDLAGLVVRHEHRGDGAAFGPIDKRIERLVTGLISRLAAAVAGTCGIVWSGIIAKGGLGATTGQLAARATLDIGDQHSLAAPPSQGTSPVRAPSRRIWHVCGAGTAGCWPGHRSRSEPRTARLSPGSRAQGRIACLTSGVTIGPIEMVELNCGAPTSQQRTDACAERNEIAKSGEFGAVVALKSMAESGHEMHRSRVER